MPSPTPFPHLLPLLLLLVLTLLTPPALSQLPALRTFGMGYSQYHLNSTEQTFFTYTLSSPNSTHGTLTHFWSTGDPSPLIDSAIFSYYLDDDLFPSSPSITFTSSMLTGTGFDDQATPWGHRWFGKGAAGAGWYNNFRVPFQRSIRVTGRLAEGGVGAGATLWMIVRGTENLPISVGGVTLPTTARLVQSRVIGTFPPLAFVPVLDVASGSGVLFSHTLAVNSTNINFLEGCYHSFTPHSQPWPGLTISTGTEDYFDSAFYFNAGPFRQENAGLTHFFDNSSSGGQVRVSAYRNHDVDPIWFQGGFRLLWRVGDVSDEAGHKCTLEKGGSPVGSPQASYVNAYTWAYVWGATEQLTPQYPSVVMEE